MIRSRADCADWWLVVVGGFEYSTEFLKVQIQYERDPWYVGH